MTANLYKESELPREHAELAAELREYHGTDGAKAADLIEGLTSRLARAFREITTLQVSFSEAQKDAAEEADRQYRSGYNHGSEAQDERVLRITEYAEQYRTALERIAKIPQTRDEEMSATGLRMLARDALAGKQNEIVCDHEWRIAMVRATGEECRFCKKCSLVEYPYRTQSQSSMSKFLGHDAAGGCLDCGGEAGNHKPGCLK